jgi:glycerol-3-phosphate dehydrogenase (NAD(P)+)
MSARAPQRLAIAVLGGGAWGTALAVAFSRQHTVTLWARDASQVSELAQRRENQRYLPGVSLPEAIIITPALATAVANAQLIVSAVPVAGLRALLGEGDLRHSPAPIFWASKGFEQGTRLMPHQVVAEVLGTERACGALSGPSFADEVGRQQPTALVAASRDVDLAQRLARELSTPTLRVYASADLVGVELGGALKNVIAIAGGICDGLALGRNARAALITRGLAEMARLGVAMGADIQTFMGLTGLGDLVLTATGDQSRNRTVGLELAAGKTLPAILAELGHVAEGVRSAASVVTLAGTAGVEMPISQAVHDVLEGRVLPAAAVMQLLTRDVKVE